MYEAIDRMVNFIHESDLIDGIANNKEIIIKQIEDRNEDGHVGAMLMLEQLAQNSINATGYITKQIICQVQDLITAEQHFGLSEMMAGLIRHINWWQSNARFQAWESNLRYIARIHFNYEVIHPFAGSNGRTNRALTYFLMLWACLPPIIFTNRDKHERYYSCFENPKDPRKMEQYFFLKINYADGALIN